MAATNTNDTQKDEHRRLFDERMAIAVSTKRDNSPYLSQEEYATIRDAVAGWETLSKEERKALGTRAYSWLKKYAVVGAGDSGVLIYAEDVAGDGADVDGEEADGAGGGGGDNPNALDTAKVVSHAGRMFDDLYAIHVEGGHCKSRTFENRLKMRFGKSIPRFAVRLPQFALATPGFTRWVDPFCRMGVRFAEWSRSFCRMVYCAPILQNDRRPYPFCRTDATILQNGTAILQNGRTILWMLP